MFAAEHLPLGIFPRQLATPRVRGYSLETVGAQDRPNNLPEQFTSFVGRGQEREQVRDALASTRLLTLTGAGGAGKTRLALQLAADALESFPRGVWWIELAALRDGDQVGAALAAVLGVRPLRGRTHLEAAVAALAGDSVLFVLDNCEHLAEATAEVAEALLRGCPGVAVLATSRVPLGVPGETDWQVPSLSLPGGGDTTTPAAVNTSDAGALFVERAVKVRPSFALTAANAPAVAGICRELDGIPLAIELAAARVRMLSVEQISAELSDRFRLLTGGPRAALPRHRTLRASVDWSYALLTDAERLLFRRLAVFADGWSLEAVESVCAGDGLDRHALLDVLASLVDRSLVAVGGYDHEVRYGLLETLRQYALELLEQSGELAALRDRHLEYFLGLGERAAIELEPPRNLEWLRRLEPEAANLDSAIAHALANDPTRALRLSVALTSWWDLGGRFSLGQAHLARALAAADQSPSELRARALWSAAYLARFAGDVDSVRRYLPQALETAASIGDEVTMGRSLMTLAHVQMTSDPKGSRAAAMRARELGRKTGDALTANQALNVMARTYLATDDELDEGERLLNEALATESGLETVSSACSGLAWVAMFRAEHERCAALCERAVAASHELNEALGQAFANSVWVHDATLQGRGAAALERALASEAQATASGAGFTFPMVRTELARAHAAVGNLKAARAVLDGLVAGGADGAWLLSRSLLLLAEVLAATDDMDGASTRAEEALQITERVGARSLWATGREVLARAAIARGEWAAADSLAHEALAVRFEIGALAWLPQSLDRLAQVAAGLESYVEAGRLLGAADRARSDLGLARWAPDAAAFEDLARVVEARVGEEASSAAWAEGRSMTLSQAIGWARRARGARKRPSLGWESLTPTERQIVDLAAQGMTNQQIAEKMFISAGTAKVHLGHIFQKLDVHSRSALAALAVRHTA